MDSKIDLEKTAEIIEKMKIANIGKNQKWESMIKKIRKHQKFSEQETEYFSNMTRIYKGPQNSVRSKIYHTKLSDLDEKPPCTECGEGSQYYCNMNDQFFCPIHVVGHDENEF